MKLPVFIVAILLLASSEAEAVDTKLICAHKETLELRTSNVITRCKDYELSLGEGPLLYISLPATKLNPNLEARFLAAQAAARKEGVELRIVSGYRTVLKQRYLFSQAVKRYGSELEAAKWVAPEEVSKHPLGLAIDINYPNDPAGAGWLDLNGFKFGLCRVFENEWWHFEATIAPGAKCPRLIKDASYLVNLNKTKLGTQSKK